MNNRPFTTRCAGATLRRVPRTVLVTSALCVFLGQPASGRADAPTQVSATVTERGAHYAVWSTVTRSTDPATGQATEQRGSFTQLENGLHYWQANQWMESKDLIELTATGAAAVRGPHKVAFSPTTGASDPITIDLVSASGQRLQSRVLGLYYFDARTGKQVAIAGLKDSTGVLYPPNRALYPDCFDGAGIKASLLYVYTKGGFEQNVLLQAPLPPPETFGLDSAYVRFQVVTVFNQPPTPTIRRITLLKADPIQAMGMVSPDLTDDLLDFGNGDLFFPVGRVFAAGTQVLANNGVPAQIRPADPSDPESVLVGKQWIDTQNGRCLLVESTPYVALAARLAALPTAGLPQDLPQPSLGLASGSTPPAGPGRVMRLATGSRPFRGVVLDFTILNGTPSSYTFTNGVTYVITNSFYISPGTATFQAGTVVKFNTNAWLLLAGNASFPSSGTPPVFTSKDDNVYGEALPAGTGMTNSTGVPYPAAAQAVWIYYPSSGQTVQNARIRWAKRGLQLDENSGLGATFYASSCKFENATIGIYENLQDSSLSLSGSSYCNVGTPIYDYSGSYSGSLTASADVTDASQYGSYSEQETTVAINPLNPSSIAAFSMLTDNTYGTNYGLLRCLSTDAGVTWTSNVVATGQTGDIPLGSADEQARFDDDGNLFFSYIGTIRPNYTNIILAFSTNAGGSLSYCTNFPSSDWLDKPVLAVGPGCIWLAWYDFALVPTFYITGASVTNHQVGTFLSPTAIQANGNYQNNKPNLAVGPNGQVVFNYVELHKYQQNGTNYNYSLIQVYTNLGGIQNPNWQYSQALSNNFASLAIPACTNRVPFQDGFMAYNRSTSSNTHPGRLYLVYTDMTSGTMNDTDIYLTYSDNDSFSWSTPTRLNSATPQRSQFFPALSVDPASGCVGVAWLDCRNDTGNTNAQPFAVISADGGASWTPNLQLSPGKSYPDGMSTAGAGFGYGDYTWIDFRNRVLHFVWADCSNYSNKNPDGKNATDMSSVRFCY